MSPSFVTKRVLVAAAMTLPLLMGTGCSWIKTKFTAEAPYQDSRLARPLEAPPGLDVPRNTGGLPVPDAAGLSGGAASSLPPTGSAVAPSAGVSEFMMADSLDSAWRRIGIALGRIEGVSMASQSALLNSYEVSYGGFSMLIRAEASAGQVRVSAVGADGKALSGGSAAELLGLLQARLN